VRDEHHNLALIPDMRGQLQDAYERNDQRDQDDKPSVYQARFSLLDVDENDTTQNLSCSITFDEARQQFVARGLKGAFVAAAGRPEDAALEVFRKWLEP
jgi:hypothetical protein